MAPPNTEHHHHKHPDGSSAASSAADGATSVAHSRAGAGQHVMPDGTVMDDAPSGHAGHQHHGGQHHAGRGHDSTHGTAGKAAVHGDQSQVEYTCPMHPQVRQMGPGNCPICGMALEPV